MSGRCSFYLVERRRSRDRAVQWDARRSDWEFTSELPTFIILHSPDTAAYGYAAMDPEEVREKAEQEGADVRRTGVHGPALALHHALFLPCCCNKEERGSQT